MNEITTEERLRIVEELNRTANDSLGDESLQRALARITGAEDASWRGVMRRVAELALARVRATAHRASPTKARHAKGLSCATLQTASAS